MKRLGPDEKRNAEKGSGDVTENKDFDFLKPLHQSLAIHIVKGRSEAAAENKKIASEKFHGAKGCLAEISHREKRNAKQTNHQSSYAQRREALPKHEGGQHCADDRNQQIQNRAIRSQGFADAPGHAQLREHLPANARNNKFDPVFRRWIRDLWICPPHPQQQRNKE